MHADDIDLLFDTNILIYLAKGEEKYLRMFEEKWIGLTLGTSVISIMELLMGVEDTTEESILSERLRHIITVPLSEEIAFASVHSLRNRAQKNLRGPHTGDTIIAETALSLGIPLVTNNPKDFASFEGLKLITP
ncbi:MAG TPA: PIN domain-containing protein [Candidatus Peribacterales bacterium]|nr:PIN domain-containing protein [Candidatus Peribacterales bacterium]